MTTRSLGLLLAGPLLLLAACSGGQNAGITDAKPVEVQFRVVAEGPVESHNTDTEPPKNTTSSAVSKDSVYEKVGVELAKRAEALAEPVTEPRQIEEFEPFAELSPGEVAMLPATMQVLVPTIGCAQIDVALAGDGADTKEIAACGRGDTKYALGPSELDSSGIASAKVNSDASQDGKHVVSVTFTKSATKDWEQLTADNVDRQVAIVVDGAVVSAPTIAAAITGSTVEISGDFSKADAEELAAQINAGAG
ncbi:MAG: SecDF P1 head subdomain-containing protein [Stackebrandtia sp.]